MTESIAPENEHPHASEGRPATYAGDIRQDHDPVRMGVSRKLTVPVTGIFLVLMAHTLVWGSSFFVPVCAAVLMYFIVNRPRRWLERRGVSPAVTAGLFCFLLGVAIFLAMYRMAEPVTSFLQDLPRMFQQIDRTLFTGGGPLEQIDKASEAAKELMKDSGEERVQVEVVEEGGAVAGFLSRAPSLFGQTVFAVVLLFFLISSGDQFIRRFVESHKTFSDKRHAVEAFHAIETQLGRYLGAITAINIGLGIVVAAAMALWGMENPIVLGGMAFAFNFVPYIGALAGVFIVFGLAFVEFYGIWPALGVALTYLAITSFERQVITPYLISQRLRLNTTVVFLTVAFFAWIWSVMGMVVALPILIVVKIASDHIDGLQTFGRFLGEYPKEKKPATPDGSPAEGRQRVPDATE